MQPENLEKQNSQYNITEKIDDNNLLENLPQKRSEDSETKTSNKNLEGDKTKYQQIADSSVDTIFRLSPTGKIIYVSPSVKELSGYNVAEIIDKPLHNFINIEQISRIFQNLFHHSSEDGKIRLEANLKSKFGKIIPVEITGRIAFSNDRPILQGTIRGITRRIEIEESIKNSEHIFRTIWEKSSEAMRLTDENGIVCLCNNSYAKLVGKNQHEIEGRNFTDVYNEDDEETLDNYLRNFTNNSVEKSGKTTILLWNGEKAHVSFSSCFIKNINGKKMLLTIYRDETERSKDEYELKRKDRILRSIAEVSKLLISTEDLHAGLESSMNILGNSIEADRTYLYKHNYERINNDEATLFVQWASEERYLKLADNIVTYSTMKELDLFNNFSNGNVVKIFIDNLSEDLKRKFQSEGTKSLILFPLYENDRYWGFLGFEAKKNWRAWEEDEESLLITIASIIGAVLNLNSAINALKEKNVELDGALSKAESAVKAKSEFLALMSHEIRTPMNGVIGMTSLLLDSGLTEEQKEYVETIRLSGDQLLVVINDILDFSKIESEKLELENQPFDLRDAIEDSLDLMSSRASEKNLDLAYIIEGSTPVTIYGDVTRLRQILTNLINNGVKFTEAGEVFVSASARKIEENKYEILFAVRDTGIGIPKDQMNKLFKSFSQVDASTSRNYGGTGLGLVISKRLSELMGGKMWVESEAGKGTTFYFTIVADSKPAQSKVFVHSSNYLLRNKKVLIVDDNITNLKILKSQVNQWNMRYEAFQVPLEALELVKQQVKFDLAVLDYQMPQIDGVTLAGELKKYSPDLPIIILSSVGRREEITLENNNISAVINKPVKHEQLYDYFVKILKTNTKNPSTNKNYQPLSNDEKTRLKLLLADDNVVNQKVAIRILNRLGYRVDVAANGLEVLDALKKIKYDLILMDIVMPELDGAAASEKIYRDYTLEEKPVIVAMTANSLDEAKENYFGTGMDDYISKPLKIEAVEDLFNKWGRAIYERKYESQNTDLIDNGKHNLVEEDKITFLKDIQTKEDVAFLLDLLETYLNDLPKTVHQISKAVEEKNYQSLRFHAHKLKGSCLTLGIDAMSELSAELEFSGKENKIEQKTYSDVNILSKDLEQVVIELRALKEKYKNI